MSYTSHIFRPLNIGTQ